MFFVSRTRGGPPLFKIPLRDGMMLFCRQQVLGMIEATGAGFADTRLFHGVEALTNPYAWRVCEQVYVEGPAGSVFYPM